MRRVLPVLLVSVLEMSCGGTGSSWLAGPSTPPPPQDCTTLSTRQWRFYSSLVETRIGVGESERLGVAPSMAVGIEPQCAGVIDSVTWTVESTAIATVVSQSPLNGRHPHPVNGWVTGVSEGVTTVTASVAFVDGRTQTAVEPVTIVPPELPPPGSYLIEDGVVELSVPSDSTRCVGPIKFSEAGRAYILIDWISPLHEVSGHLQEGYSPRGEGQGCVGLVVADPAWRHPHDVEPRRAEGAVDAGVYGLTVHGSRPDGFVETVRYEVWLTPG